jgi:signal peptidase I
MTILRGMSGTCATLLILVVLVGCGGSGTAAAQRASTYPTYTVPSGAMEPTLTVGSTVSVDPARHPADGSIVVFHPPANYTSCANPDQGGNVAGEPRAKACDVVQAGDSAQIFVKRVVGVGGDHLKIVNGHVYRDGKRESDAYIIRCDGIPICNFPGVIVVPKGDYYVIGDNRPDSDDSRFWGPVRASWIIGTVVAIAGPRRHAG